jgi:predicted ArsR family transcriptional regulator
LQEKVFLIPVLSQRFLSKYGDTPNLLVFTLFTRIVMDIASNIEDDLSQHGVRPVDQAVLDLLRRERGMTVTELIDRLDVTATAVRQRLDRLVEMGLIERRKETAGRGRPTFRYHLSAAGWREVGATYADLAVAMWKEVSQMPDGELKQELLQRVTKRMGQAYQDELPSGTLEERLASMVRVLGERKIPAKFEMSGDLPVLEVHACPYPGLVHSERDRAVCELEQQVLTAAMGQTMELSKCRLDGHGTCQFRPADNSNQEPKND